ncbi:MAG: response regulator, partial [Pyrinomonadaceae bacterium]
MNSTRVLLVDDHALVRAGICALIGMIAGVEVVGEAGEAVEALRMIEKLSPDLVLLDITMPGMSGLKVLDEITARYPTVRVIMLTMHDQPQYVIQAFRYGARGYVLKDSPADEIVAAVHTVMAG